MQDYRKLKVWHSARRLTKAVYVLSDTFPRSERFGLTQQMRRAAISISSNIAEGCGRGTQREMARFLSIASGSAHELESQLILAGDLGFGDVNSLAAITRSIGELKSMLASLRQTVQRSLKSS